MFHRYDDHLITDKPDYLCNVTTDELYMSRCLQLAKLGEGNVAPNPMVGAVIVHGGKIIGEGYHQAYGGPHAEVNAIASVKDESLLQYSTLYVNLEPCSHFGKTPPCADLVVAKQIPRVVIGSTDSHSKVAGKGIEKLKAAGIDVTVGVLEKECRELNKAFFTFHEKQRPYVILKWAQSADGFMDIDRSGGKKGIAWITQPETQSLVHSWRSKVSALLVGWKTIANDNPQLTCREVAGKNPMRIVIDPGLRLDYAAYKIADGAAPAIILTAKQATGNTSFRFVNPADFSIDAILKALWQENIQSVLVEGGSTTLQHFIDSGLWDEARVLTGITKIEHGCKAPTISGNSFESLPFGQDEVKMLFNEL